MQQTPIAAPDTFDLGAEPGPEATYADRLCLPMTFDPARLAADLDRLDADDWVAHFVRQNYSGDWSILPLRAPAGAVHPILRVTAHPWTKDWEDTELLAASPYFRQVLAAFECPIEAARLMRLGAGSVIREHNDPDLGAEWGCARLHIPVRTNAAVDFRLNGRRVDMVAGSVWYLRLADPHSVTNGGETARVHLVIDVRMNDWLRDMLGRATSGPAA